METEVKLNLKVDDINCGDDVSISHWLQAYRRTSKWTHWNHVAQVDTVEEVNELLQTYWSKIEQIQFNDGVAMILTCEMEHHGVCDTKLLAIVRDTGGCDMYLTTATHSLNADEESREAIERTRGAESDLDSQVAPSTPTPTTSSANENSDAASPEPNLSDGAHSVPLPRLSSAASSNGSAAAVDDFEHVDEVPVIPEGHQEIKYKITTDVADLEFEANLGCIYHFDCHLWVVKFSGKKLPCLVPTTVMNRHFPQTVIKYYERRIDWNESKSHFKVRLSESNAALSLAKFDCECVTKPY